MPKEVKNLTPQAIFEVLGNRGQWHGRIDANSASGTVGDSQRPFIDLQIAPQVNAHLDVHEVDARRLPDD